MQRLKLIYKLYGLGLSGRSLVHWLNCGGVRVTTPEMATGTEPQVSLTSWNTGGIDEEYLWKNFPTDEMTNTLYPEIKMLGSTAATQLLIPVTEPRVVGRIRRRVKKHEHYGTVVWCDSIDEHYYKLSIASRPGKGREGFEAMFGNVFAKEIYMISPCGQLEHQPSVCPGYTEEMDMNGKYNPSSWDNAVEGAPGLDAVPLNLEYRKTIYEIESLMKSAQTRMIFNESELGAKTNWLKSEKGYGTETLLSWVDDTYVIFHCMSAGYDAFVSRYGKDNADELRSCAVSGTFVYECERQL
jgi:hypothetical protein